MRQFLKDGETGVVLRSQMNAMFAELYGFTSAILQLQDASTILTDCSNNARFSVILGGNRTLANPTSMQIGVKYTWLVFQDATGSRGLTYGTVFSLKDGDGSLSTAPNALDIIEGIYDGVKVRTKIDKGW